MTDFIPSVAMTALIITIVNFLRYARGRDLDGVTTIGVVWLAGVVTTMLAAQSDFAGGLEYGGLSLATMNIWSQLLVGLSVASTGSVVVDFRKALDNTDSAAKPSLVLPGFVSEEHVDPHDHG